MTDSYTPATTDGQVMARAELDLIAAASAALEARIAAIEARRAYSGMRIDTNKALSLSVTPLEVVGWDAPGTLAAERGVASDVSAGTLTVASAGVYMLDMRLFLSNTDTAVTYGASVYRNHAAAGGIEGGTPAKNVDQVALAAFSQPVNLSAGDVLSVYLSADANSNVTLDYAMLRMVRID